MPDVPAEPYPFPLSFAAAALIVIDVQRDFLEPGGFGASLGNDVALLQRVVAPTRALLDVWREAGLPVVHTREGHAGDLSDLPPSKRRRGDATIRIGDVGPMGRVLIRGEPGHAIVEALAPRPGELIVDKPGKGAFFATDLHERLTDGGVRQLIVCGVTTEVCVHASVREANDRGYDCLVLADCTASYSAAFHDAALAMISAQGAILGWVGRSADVIAALRDA